MDERAGERAGHIVLCGLESLGLRTLEELHRTGEEVVVVAREASEQFEARALQLGATIIHGDCTRESILRNAGVERASAIVLTEANDVGNLHAALAAQELNPAIRVVLRMFNEELGARIPALFSDCHALSASAIAAPSFVAAALYEEWEQRIAAGGRTLVVRKPTGTPHPRPDASPGDVVLPLARVDPEGATTLFPIEADGAICLVFDNAASDPAQVRIQSAAARRGKARSAGSTGAAGLLGRARRIIGALPRLADAKLGYLLVAMLLLAAFGTIVFNLLGHLDFAQAFYFTVSILTGAGFDPPTIDDSSWVLKFFVVLVVVMGAVALTLFYTFVTDALVGARLARMLGAARGPLKDHIVVCGCGSIGYRVVEQISRRGIPVIAAELRENDFIPTIRRMGVPVLLADVRLKETLEELDVGKARCLVAATDDDLANLQAALGARAINPRLRVVLRLFDPDLAQRVERAFGITISRSVSSLAAPSFAAAALGGHVIATIAAGTRVLIVGQATIDAGSPADGMKVAALQQEIDGRAILLAGRGSERWGPDPSTTLAPGDVITVVATRRGFAHLSEVIAAPSRSIEQAAAPLA